ncbi:MAG: MarR family winged helix-turn-helix transcriptional regulator [Acutalibacteraceae bacterium]|nr:MarR family winged helix-turn-helix transcriptional regulator [Acutalibacteraceae bacterium]
MRRISGYISVLHRRALQFYNKFEDETGLKGVQYPYIFYLGRHEGCRQDEIAEHLHVNKSNVTRQIEKLKAAEMIDVRKDPDDERVCRVYLTEKAKEARIAVDKAVDKWNEIITFGLSQDEATLLKSLLDKALTSAKEADV